MKKYLLAPVSLALHTKMKWKCAQEDISMSEAIRQLVTGYVNGSIELGSAEVQVARIPVETEPPDIYDYLAEKAATLVID
jgi:hypothetical protein